MAPVDLVLFFTLIKSESFLKRVFFPPGWTLFLLPLKESCFDRDKPRLEEGASCGALANWNAPSLCDQTKTELSKTSRWRKQKVNSPAALLQLNSDQRKAEVFHLQPPAA